jgi:ABC-type transport system involved in multi-copper enzyme maturation permease subunit
MASETASDVAAAPIPRGLALARRQIGAMFGLELRKTFLRLRALPVVLVALLPAVLLGLRALSHRFGGARALPAPEVALSYANVFQFFFLRAVVFFVAFAVFTYLVRGETAERSLHFYLLAPLRRETFLLGKYLTGVVAAAALALTSLALQLALAFLPAVTEGGAAYLLRGPGRGHALAYAGVTVLAIVGYGAVFAALALVVRNPMIPAAPVLGWEWINPFLPQALQKISVIHHLQALCPVPVSRGPWALPADPTSPPVATLSLLALAAVLVGLAMRRARRLEVLYSGD